jgi:acyl carrier protein
VDQVRTSAFLELFGTGVTFDTRIEDLEMDSLEFLDLIQEISSKFGPVSDEVVSKVCTVKELFDAIPA